MPGMNSGLNARDPVVVAAFRAALIHQGIVALLIFLLVGAVWAGAGGRFTPMSGAASRAAAWAAEPAGRRLLRIGFGLLWIFDGLLQAQPAMAVGLPSQVIEPTAASSPQWVQHVVNWGGTTWSYHPIQAGAAAVWIQVGIGIWLMAAADGPWSRLAGLASAGWGLVVWVFGESFGGIFAPGLTWLFGAPGAASCYCAAGALVALPARYWRTPRLGRAVLAVMGVFFAGMAVLQAWPGRGFWQGTQHGHPGTLTAMTASMAQTPQPGFLATWVRAFNSFDQAHGFGVNLVAVIALALLGVALLAARPLQDARPAVLRAAVVFLVVLCLADWVLIEDLGFFGGLGTDPNSMIPLLLLVVAGYLALTSVPVVAPTEATAPAAAPTPAAAAGPAAGAGWRDRFGPASLRRAIGTASARSVVSAGAVGVILLGAAPMAAAQASRTADPILAESIAGSSAPRRMVAPLAAANASSVPGSPCRAACASRVDSSTRPSYTPWSGRSRGVTNAVSRAWPGARSCQVPAASSTAIAAVGNFSRIRARSPGLAAQRPVAAASMRARSSTAGLCPMSSSVPVAGGTSRIRASSPVPSSP